MGTRKVPQLGMSIPLRIFSVEELRTYNGTTRDEVFVALYDKEISEFVVYDCSQSMHLYGPDKPYNVFAGRDASRALGISTTDAKEVRDLSIEGLTYAQHESLKSWVSKFNSKYPKVGTLKARSKL